MDEAALTSAILGVQMGDRERYAPIVQWYGPLIATKVGASGLFGQDRDDLVQQTFVQAWKKLPQLRDPSRFRSWLLTIASNLVRDFLKRKGRERHVMNNLQTVIPHHTEEPTPDRGARLTRLEALIPGLKESEREILELRFAQGKNCREIADLLGRNHATVRSSLQRALKVLRVGLEKEEQA